MNLRRALRRPFGEGKPAPVVVREYGRDSLLVWANLLLAPLFGLMGLRVGLQSEARLSARMETDTASMRKRGYLVAKVETFSLPVLGAPGQAASWYRVTYERPVAPSA